LLRVNEDGMQLSTLDTCVSQQIDMYK